MLKVHWREDVLTLPHCQAQVGVRHELIFIGPRIKMGIYEGIPTRIAPHTTTGSADYFGPLVNRYTALLMRPLGTCVSVSVCLFVCHGASRQREILHSAGKPHWQTPLASPTGKSQLACPIGKPHRQAPLASPNGKPHWQAPLASPIGKPHWQAPLASPIGKPYWQAPWQALLACLIGMPHWQIPLASPNDKSHWQALLSSPWNTPALLRVLLLHSRSSEDLAMDTSLTHCSVCYQVCDHTKDIPTTVNQIVCIPA